VLSIFSKRSFIDKSILDRKERFYDHSVCVCERALRQSEASIDFAWADLDAGLCILITAIRAEQGYTTFRSRTCLTQPATAIYKARGIIHTHMHTHCALAQTRRLSHTHTPYFCSHIKNHIFLFAKKKICLQMLLLRSS
jgi:hypothetical protein